MIRNFLILIIFLSISGCATVPRETDCVQEKWEYVVDDWMNVITLCQNEGSASMNVYYPNTKLDSPATSCFQIGTAIVNENELYFDLRPGYCKNGRDAESIKFSCEVFDSEMRCIDSRQKRILVFQKKDV